MRVIEVFNHLDGTAQTSLWLLCTVEPRFNKVPRDWANWFFIFRVYYIENLDIMNLLENNLIFRYIGV